MFLILGIVAIANIIIFVVIEKLAPRWPTWRSLLTTAVALPASLWAIVLAFDIYSAIWHSRHPGEPFMGGLSVYLFPLAIMGIVFSVLAILGFIFVRDTIRSKP